MSKNARKRPPHAVYNITYYDYMWNEIESLRKVHAQASDVVIAFDTWNRETQREARDTGAIVIANALPCAIGVEVVYV